MDAQFQIGRQPAPFDDKGDHREIGVELLLELGQLANVIDAFVEAPSKLRSDRLERDARAGGSLRGAIAWLPLARDH